MNNLVPSGNYEVEIKGHGDFQFFGNVGFDFTNKTIVFCLMEQKDLSVLKWLQQLPESIFANALDNTEEITVHFSDEDNNLLFSWTFSNLKRYCWNAGIQETPVNPYGVPVGSCQVPLSYNISLYYKNFSTEIAKP